MAEIVAELEKYLENSGNYLKRVIKRLNKKGEFEKISKILNSYLNIDIYEYILPRAPKELGEDKIISRIGIINLYCERLQKTISDMSSIIDTTRYWGFRPKNLDIDHVSYNNICEIKSFEDIIELIEKGRKTKKECAELCIEKIYEEAVRRVKKEIERFEGEVPETDSLQELIEKRSRFKVDIYTPPSEKDYQQQLKEWKKALKEYEKSNFLKRLFKRSPKPPTRAIDTSDSTDFYWAIMNVLFFIRPTNINELSPRSLKMLLELNRYEKKIISNYPSYFDNEIQIRYKLGEDDNVLNQCLENAEEDDRKDAEISLKILKYLDKE